MNLQKSECDDASICYYETVSLEVQVFVGKELCSTAVYSVHLYVFIVYLGCINENS